MEEQKKHEKKCNMTPPKLNCTEINTNDSEVDKISKN
jgi:hypothetical protein